MLFRSQPAITDSSRLVPKKQAARMAVLRVRTLVVPRLLTTPERKFVENLNSGSTPPAIRIVNRTALDDWLADDPDLDKYLQRDPETALREMARTYRDRTVRVRDLRTGGNTRVIRLGVSVLWVTKPQNDLVVAGHAAGLTALRI